MINYLRVLVLSAGGLLLLLLVSGCAGRVELEGAGGGPTGAGATTKTDPVWVGGDAVLAIRRLHFGDLGADGAPSSTAWASHGFDLDGKSSTTSSTDLCKPAAGAQPEAVYPDGNDGIDNAFGKSILPLLTVLEPELSQEASASIEQGRGTMLVRIRAPAPGSKDNNLLSQLYFGTFPPEVMPKWDGLDAWLLDAAMLEAGDVETPKIQLPNAFLAEGPSGERRWWSGDPTDVHLLLPLGFFTMRLRLRRAVIAMDLTLDNTHATGVIGGVLDADELLDELATALLYYAPGRFCPPCDCPGILQQVEQAPDILADGTQDPDEKCNGISLGLRFEAEAGALGTVVELLPDPNPCQ